MTTLKRTKPRKRLRRTKKMFMFSTVLNKPAKCAVCEMKAKKQGIKYVPKLYKDESGLIFCECKRFVDIGNSEPLIKSKGMCYE